MPTKAKRRQRSSGPPTLTFRHYLPNGIWIQTRLPDVPPLPTETRDLHYEWYFPPATGRSEFCEHEEQEIDVWMLNYVMPTAARRWNHPLIYHNDGRYWDIPPDGTTPIPKR